MKTPKPGYRTTKFQLVIISALIAGLSAVSGQVEPKWSVAITAALAGLYALSRGLAKSSSRPRRDDDDDDGGDTAPAGAMPRMAASLAILLLPLIWLWTGCASHSTHQVDRRPDGTEVSTRARAVAFMAGKSSLRQYKASQTAKTQGMSVGSLDQEADANPLMQTLGKVMMDGLKAYLSGGASTLVPTGTGTPAAAPAVVAIPEGWKLVPKDDPSAARPEIDPVR